jgi:hypothetical protein
MSEALQERPATDDRDAWYTYWKSLGMSWRREPEIGAERQVFLDERRRTVRPAIAQGLYPFKDVPLTRADVEWLLATHESDGERGPVDWSDGKQREREGIDLRGADLRAADLHSLPLARVHAGPNLREWLRSTREQREMAAVHLEGANLFGAHLEGAILNHAHLEGADLSQAHLEGAFVGDAHLEGKRPSADDLDVLRGRSPTISDVLWPADLRDVFLDPTVKLIRTTVGNEAFGFISVLDAHWNGANLASIQWKPARRRRLAGVVLGDERKARLPHDAKGSPKDAEVRLGEYEEAVRANRQLAGTLREQGLNETGDYFAYQAQVCQRQVLRRQGQYGRALGSWLLDLVSGYGYRPLRSVVAYVLVIIFFAGLYLVNGQFAAPHLRWDEALVLSVSSFHGRGFFSSEISLGDTLARLAAGEAIVGLLIEITFIATFTQRFFAR